MSGVQVFTGSTLNSTSSKDPLNIESIDVDTLEDVKPVVVCRGCLVSEQPLQPLDHQLAHAYGLLVSSIQEPDIFPRYICTYCSASLLRFTAFREKCVTVQSALTDLHSAGTPITLDLINSHIKKTPYPLKTTFTQVMSYVPPKNQQFEAFANKNQGDTNNIYISELKSEVSDSGSQVNNDGIWQNDSLVVEVPAFTTDNINRDTSIDPDNKTSEIHGTTVKNNSMTPEQRKTKRIKKTSVKNEKDCSEYDTSINELTDNNAFNSMEDSDTESNFSNKRSRRNAKSNLEDIRVIVNKIKSKSKKKRNCVGDENAAEIKIVPEKKKKGRVKSSTDRPLSDRTTPERKRRGRTTLSTNKSKTATVNNIEIPENSNATLETSFQNEISPKKSTKHQRKNKNKKTDKQADEEQRQMELEKEFDIKIIELTKEQQLQQVKDRKDSLSYQQAKFKCELCYNVFILKETFNNHMAKHQLDDGKDICEICIRSVSKKKMTEHVRLHHKFDYICNQCGHISKILGSARIHYRWHKGIKYDCKICGKFFDKPTSVLGHMHLSHKDVMAKCPVCGKQCIGEKGLKSHMNLSHKEAIGAVCSCGVQFHSVEALQRHRPNGVCDQTKRPCVLCGMGFTSELLLRQHKSICDSKKQYLCDFCNVSFESQIRYKKHVVTHPSYHRLYSNAYTPKCASYMCEHCGKNCRTKQIFETHTRTHTGERPFICDYCGKSFAAKPLLVIHINRHMVKMSSKPCRMYACRYCGKQFTCPANKRRHEMTNHQGLVQFNCEICGATFTTKKAMQDHVRHTHEGVPWPKRQRNRRQ